MVTDDNEFSYTQEGLCPGKGASTILHMLHNAIDVLQVFEYKALNARVLIEDSRATVFVRVGRLRAFDTNIVEVRLSEFGDFGLKDVNDVFVEYRNGVHQKKPYGYRLL